MKTRKETIVVEEYPEIYPPTAECKKYLKMRGEHEEASTRRAFASFGAAIAGTSGINNAADNEKFREIQYAYQDCQMTALAFFASKKAVVDKPAVSDENENKLGK